MKMYEAFVDVFLMVPTDPVVSHQSPEGQGDPTGGSESLRGTEDDKTALFPPLAGFKVWFTLTVLGHLIQQWKPLQNKATALWTQQFRFNCFQNLLLVELLCVK